MPGGPDLTVPEIFPSIEKELGPYRHYFKGKVLNAGAGRRDISSLVDGELFNQDLQDAPHIDVAGPLHEIPVDDGFFDTIICNAVLEHVMNPEDVMAEFARVIRPGGALYLGVPFMQPEHKDPGDYQRYTLDGLALLVERHGFVVRERGVVHNVYTTLGWIAREWLTSADSYGYRVLRRVLFPWLARKSRVSRHQVHSLASAYRVVAARSED
jgi:SAM-dependent methyltransferase